MKKTVLLCLLFVLIVPYALIAQEEEKNQLDELFEKQKANRENITEKQTYVNDTPFDIPIPLKANKQFQALVFSYTHGVVQNFAAESQFLKGQTVGRLFGANTTKTFDDRSASYFEQRTLPFFIYSPQIFDGKVTLRASFHIDFTWGDNAYGTGGHSGGALSGDNVNIQTQNVEVEYRPAPTWAINLGLQRLYDTPHDTYRTMLDKMANTGYRLNYWGTNGAGIAVRKDADWYKVKAGFYQLYENNIELMDDVHLFELTSEFNVAKNWNVGGSVYHLRDRSDGKGGVSILGQGPKSLLNDYNGTFKFLLGEDPIKTDVTWIGGFFSRNPDFVNDRWLLSGYINSNIGQIQQDNGSGYKKAVDIAGFAANLRAGYRYGQTENDAVTLDMLYTSPNKNGITDKKYSGVITGNTWGSPVGLMFGMGSYLVFPHANVVNRYTAAITDLSNMGYGVSGFTLNGGHDIIPNKFHAKIGTAAAMANEKPLNGDKFMGWEVNGKLSYDLGAFLTLEAHGAYMGLGDFYKSPSVNGNRASKPANPWTTVLGLRWLIF